MANPTKRDEDDDDQEELTPTPPETAAKTAAKTPEQVDRMIEQASRDFAAAVPVEANSQGHFELPPEHPLAMIAYDDVPDGRYRVGGHDWILEFEDGRLTSAEKASAASDPEKDNYQYVPSR